MASEWSEVVLSEVMEVRHGFAFPGSNIRDEPPGDILLTPGNFAIGGGFKGDKFKYFDGPVPDDYVLSEDDLVVTMTDLSKQADTLGYPALVPRPHGARFLHNQRLGKIVIRPNAQLETRFLFYLLRTAEYRHEVLASATGTTVKHTSPNRILAHKAAIPPLAEQRAIANILGVLDDKIELNRRMNETLEGLARAIFQSWFVDFDPVRARSMGVPPMMESAPPVKAHAEAVQEQNQGRDAPATFSPTTAALFPDSFEDSELGKIPKGWKWCALREIADIVSGGTPHKGTEEFWNGAIPWVSPKAMNQIHVSDSDEHVTECAVGNGTRRVPKGTVLVMVRGMGLHQGVRISQAQRDVTFNQDVKAIIAKSVPAVFLLYGLLDAATMLLSKVHASGHGTGVLSTEFLDRLTFAIPPDKVLARLTESLAVVNDRIASNDRETDQLATIRDALLPKLLSGEIRVAEAERLVEEVG